jgi:heat shock protein HtpX
MAFLGRIFLFFLVNALVVITVSVVLNILGVKPYITQYGLDYTSLAIVCGVYGMGSSLVSLMLSRALVKWQAGVQVIPADTRDPSLRRLVDIVHGLARKANLPLPEVGIYDSPDPNAFATGPTKSMALVAVSTGLLSRMNMAEIEGVLGHEITHISNGDMVTMALLQGVVNAFVGFLSTVIAYVLTSNRDRDENYRGPGFMYYIVQFVMQIIFMALGSIIVCWFSRWREYRADAGSARLAGKEKMISALQSLQQNYELVVPNARPTVQSMQISSRGGFNLWADHPPLEDRIRRLQEGNY